MRAIKQADCDAHLAFGRIVLGECSGQFSEGRISKGGMYGGLFGGKVSGGELRGNVPGIVQGGCLDSHAKLQVSMYSGCDFRHLG